MARLKEQYVNEIAPALNMTRQANHYLGFDKDEAGRGFVKNFI